MKKPKTYLAAQGFRLKNKDVTFRINPRRSNVLRFTEVLGSTVRPIGTVKYFAIGR